MPATTTRDMDIDVRHLEANGVRLNVARAGSGPALLLVHGWPHTWEVWREVMPALATAHTVVAPDLRGMGSSERASSGYDGVTLASDLAGLLDALKIDNVSVWAIDAGVAPAFVLALAQSHRVNELVVMEGLVGPLPGAEQFLAAGPPWWFGFHGVPGFAERVLAGNERIYIDFFLRAGLAGGRQIAPAIREAFLDAYATTAGLRGGFEVYRALRKTGQQILELTAAQRLTIPTLAVAGGVVGDALRRQLAGVTDDLAAAAIPDCGHIIPLDQPHALVEAVARWQTGRMRPARRHSVSP